MSEYPPRKISLREANPLVNSYDTSDMINILGADQLQLMVSFVKGESEGCRLKIEFSEDGINWYPETRYEIITDTNTVKHHLALKRMNTTSNSLISIPVSSKFFRVSAMAITSGIGTSLSIIAIAANLYTGRNIIYP